MIRDDNSVGNMEDSPPPLSTPDYSRAYEAFGGAGVVNDLRNQFLGMGIDENTIGSIFSKYYTPEAPPPQTMTPPIEPERPQETMRPPDPPEEPRYEPEMPRPDPRPERPEIRPVDPREREEAEERRREQESRDRQRADEEYYFRMRNAQNPPPEEPRLDPRPDPSPERPEIYPTDPGFYQPPVDYTPTRPIDYYNPSPPMDFTQDPGFYQPPVSNELSGVILAGASWMAGDENTQLAEEIFGQPVTNTAVGGQKTSDVLNQLNVFERDGGTFAPGSTVVLDIGANDIAQGVDEKTIRSNLDEIISRLAASGVDVVLSGQPEANSYEEAIARTDLQMDDLYSDLAKKHSNVTLVDAMSEFLNKKDLMDESGFHLNSTDAKLAYLNRFADAFKKTQRG